MWRGVTETFVYVRVYSITQLNQNRREASRRQYITHIFFFIFKLFLLHDTLRLLAASPELLRRSSSGTLADPSTPPDGRAAHRSVCSVHGHPRDRFPKKDFAIVTSSMSVFGQWPRHARSARLGCLARTKTDGQTSRRPTVRPRGF